LIVQVAGTILPMFGAPDWVARTVVILLAIGFIPDTARRLDRMLIGVLVVALGYFAVDKSTKYARRAVYTQTVDMLIGCRHVAANCQSCRRSEG
jgi:hypothetical protein